MMIGFLLKKKVLPPLESLLGLIQWKEFTKKWTVPVVDPAVSVLNKHFIVL